MIHQFHSSSIVFVYTFECICRCVKQPITFYIEISFYKSYYFIKRPMIFANRTVAIKTTKVLLIPISLVASDRSNNNNNNNNNNNKKMI